VARAAALSGVLAEGSAVAETVRAWTVVAEAATWDRGGRVLEGTPPGAQQQPGRDEHYHAACGPVSVSAKPPAREVIFNCLLPNVSFGIHYCFGGLLSRAQIKGELSMRGIMRSRPPRKPRAI
jgi:hypothetical protein